MPTTGRVLTVEGDVGVSDDGAGHFLSWHNQSALGGNPDLFAEPGSPGPDLGVESLDGVPGLSYPTATQPVYLIALGSGSHVKLKNRSGVNFGFGAGEHQPRTAISVFRPRNASAFFNITGGTLMRFGTTTGGGHQDFECLFNVEPLVDADGWFLFSNNWRNGYNTADTLRGPPQAGGDGGSWDGVAAVSMTWFDGATLKVFVNDFTTPIISTTMPAADSGHPDNDFFTYGTVDQVADQNGQWHGGRFADYIFDWGIDAATIYYAAVALKAKFPSLPITLPAAPAHPTISPRRLISVPGGKVLFSASGGSGSGYVFSFPPGGNRSGASLNGSTGEYLAGATGPAEDLVVVTDSNSATDEAEVSVTGTLYRDYQSKTPAGRKGPLLLSIERVYGGEKDIQFERARQAAVAGLPTVGPPDALDYVATDRILPRAVTEAPADDGGPLDQAFAERLRTVWDGVDGWSFGGGHPGLLRALTRAGFPAGDPDGAHIIQRTRTLSYLTGGTPTFVDHLGLFDPNPAAPAGSWHYFGLLFGADFTPPIGSVFQDGDPSAKLLNALVRTWKPGKARFLGSWVVVSGPTWGWPLGVEWGDLGRVWGGGVTRFVAPA
jgi:hypothetical protein